MRVVSRFGLHFCMEKNTKSGQDRSAERKTSVIEGKPKLPNRNSKAHIFSLKENAENMQALQNKR